MRSILILCFILEALIIMSVYSCPAVCICKHVGPQEERLKVKCNKGIEDIKKINIDVVSVQLYHLDISKNNIYVIEAEIFKNLTNLRRLDISNNKLTALVEGGFDGLGNLERLDLSKNQISSIDSLAFRSLNNLKKLDLSANKLNNVAPTLFHDLLALERLKLNNNALKTLAEGSFHGLKLMKQLDLSNNPWRCDCYIYWMSNWKNNSLFKLSPGPTCDSPPNLHGQSIIDLRFSDEFQCEWTSPAIEIRPSQNQVVFAGDAISLKCSAPSIIDDKNAKLNWLWNPNSIINSTDTPFSLVDPQNILSNIKIENRYLSDSGIIDSVLNIFSVKEEHNGQWHCFLMSHYGNKSKTIGIIVISDDTKYCPLVITRNNKGIYAWPRTVIGWKVELPCEGMGLSTLMPIPLRASYQCNSTGYWVNLNTDSCPFISPITKALEQYSKVNLSLTKGNLLETAKRFNHTADPKKITDPIEIHFITKTVENYLNFLNDEKELGTMLIEIITSIMNLPRDMLKIAEINYNACTRLIKAVEKITESTPSIQINKKNFSLKEFRIEHEHFVGLTCTWSSNIVTDNIESRQLHCAINNRTTKTNNNRTLEASIQLPASLLQNLNSTTATHQLMISIYSDNNLFPMLKVNNKNRKMDISSGIIGTKIIGMPIVNLTDDVFIILKVPHYFSATSRPIPVIWNEKLNETGNWTTDGCNASNYFNNLVVFTCKRLGYYGLMEDITYLNGNSLNSSGAKFRYSNPAIYIGTFVIIICLTYTSVTYVICYTSIVMPKRAKHSVINTWIAITLLCFLYTVGIYQTENIKLCEDIGLVLHYLSLCCLLWMVVSASNMYKRLSKSDITAVPDDEIHEPPIQKPILGLYLVGWGVALIVCGISGAINLHEYASYSYCFLTSRPALAALFVPGIFLTLYLIVCYLMVRCTIRSTDVNGQLSEGTQATENMDLELLEPHENRATDQNSIHSTQTVSSEVEDVEHSQVTQLKGHIGILILYLMMWCSGAAVTALPFNLSIPHEETIFAIIYAITASTLGLFVLMFYGIARSDVRSQWTLMRCWLRQKKNRCCRTRSVSDANPSIPAQPLVQNISPPISNSQTTQVISDTNSVNSSRHTSISRTCHILKAPKIAGDSLHLTTSKIPNVNLVVLHRQQYRSNNSVTTYTDATPSACVEMFYNPHQSGVARKFFKKQRRHTKNNNLGPRKQGDGGVTSDGGSCISLPRPAPKITEEIDSIETNMFSSSAKVNNTNIHVEKNQVKDTKNINILSDSCGSVSEDHNVPVHYVIGQDNIVINTNKKVNNDLLTYIELGRVTTEVQAHSTTMSPNESDFDIRTDEEKHLRNVSQQCSLEYSSELESATQIMSERSDHNLSEIGETPERITDNDFRCSSLKEITEKSESSPQRNVERLSEHSSSLYCLSTTQYSLPPPPPFCISYRNSFNDITSLGESSKICKADSHASMDDLRSEVSSDVNSRLRRNSQRSLTDENSLSEMTYTRDLPLFTNSLSDINRISVNSCENNDEQFEILDGITLPNLTVNDDLINRSKNLPYLNKEYNSLTDLTSIDVTLGATRHLDMNASIGVDYEDTNYSNSEPYTDDTALDDEVLLDSNSIKKETSV